MSTVRNYSEPKLTALVFGATGLVGKEILEVLLNDKKYSKILVANRREVGYPNQDLEEKVVDFNQLEKSSDCFKVDHVFICLGTTIKKAGSKQAFEEVDLKYPVEIAKISKEKKVKVLVHISALGANSDSSNFYMKTKGKAEELIDRFGPKCSYAVRPSMLFGEREEFRLGEVIGKFLMKNLEFIMVGPLKQYRGIYASDVAKAMVEIAHKTPFTKKIKSEDLKVISKDKS